ncbi:hypothetical protein CDIK_2256 [Cucumispora dikerogammari]|nr:hypothetical protein CDIK_2256 [Cucumispora dikerogammari]
MCDVLPSFKLSEDEYLFKKRYADIIRRWDYSPGLEESISTLPIKDIAKTQTTDRKITKKQEKIESHRCKIRHRIGYFLNTYIVSETDTLFKQEKSARTCKILKKLHALKEHLKIMNKKRTEETLRSFFKEKIKEIYFFYQQFFSDSKDIIKHTENKDDIQEQVFVAIYEKVHKNMIKRLPCMFISYNEYLRDPGENLLETVFN